MEGRPALIPATSCYEVANGQPLPTLGVFSASVALQENGGSSIPLNFTVAKIPKLNLLGRDTIVKLGINVSALMGVHSEAQQNFSVKTIQSPEADLFKTELGCHKDFQLEMKFKPSTKTVFSKPRVVPFSIQDDLCKAYDAGIAKGVWQPIQFNDYGTLVVSIRKAALPGQVSPKLRVCGDYSVTVNPQLEPHRYPMPCPEDLMQRLGGGHGFTKIDLADAYNQILLAPERQKRLALSTHRGVLLQKRFPFDISSAPGYFQEIMDKLTKDLQGVAVYMDDILVSGATAAEHLQNLHALLRCLEEKGLRCRLEKCSFAQPSIEYLGHTLSQQGIAKRSMQSRKTWLAYDLSWALCSFTASFCPTWLLSLSHFIALLRQRLHGVEVQSKQKLFRG